VLLVCCRYVGELLVCYWCVGGLLVVLLVSCSCVDELLVCYCCVVRMLMRCWCVIAVLLVCR